MIDRPWTYIDPLAMYNIEAERRELGLESLRRRASGPRKSEHGSIGWWVLQYETAGRALMRAPSAAAGSDASNAR